MVLINKLNQIRKNENETIREFHTRFQNLSQQLPRTYHPRPQFLIFLYIREFLGQSKLFLDKKVLRSIQESYKMAIEVEANISSSKEEQSFVSEVNIGEPKYTPNILKRILFLETFVEEFPKGLEKGINQQEVEEREIDEGYQSHGEEQDFTHASSKDN
jgi:hypothetical protein